MNFRNSFYFLLIAVFLTAAGCSRQAEPERGIREVDGLSGTVGEMEDGSWIIAAGPSPIPAGAEVSIELPGVIYPTEPNKMLPKVKAVLQGIELPAADETLRDKCPSDSRTFYRKTFTIDKDVPAGGVFGLFVEDYQLPFRAIAQLGFRIRLKTEGESLSASFKGDVQAGPCVHVFVDGASVISTGTPIEFEFSCVDKYGNQAGPIDEKLYLEENGQRLDIPPIQLEDNGLADVTLPPRDPGLYRYSIIRGEKEIGSSGPVLIRSEKGAGYGLLWGDLHSHTGFSDAYTTAKPADSLGYTVGVAHLDFAAVTDHVESIWGCKTSREKRIDNLEAFNRFSSSVGKFTPLLGYEWTGSFHFGDKTFPVDDGHAHVLFDKKSDGVSIKPKLEMEYKQDYCPADETGCSDFEALLKYAEENNAIAIRHHTIAHWGAASFPAEDSPAMPVVEITSSHGSSECGDCPGRIPQPAAKTSVQQALLTGLHLGFVGGTDNHHARPGSREFPGKEFLFLDAGGVTCVLADENSHEAIFDAIRKRRTYATTGDRIIVDFTVNGKVMGSILPSLEEAPLKYEVHGTAPITLVEILRGDLDTQEIKPIYKKGNPGLDAKGQWADPNPPKRGFYYLRLTQENKQMAWSSPIWLEPKE